MFCYVNSVREALPCASCDPTLCILVHFVSSVLNLCSCTCSCPDYVFCSKYEAAREYPNCKWNPKTALPAPQNYSEISVVGQQEKN